MVVLICEFHKGVEIQLGALGRQAQAADLEYILVDDGSADRVASWAPRGHAGIEVRILRNTSPIGPSMSRNRGWQTARGRHIVFLDPDMIPAPGWLDAYRRSVQSNASVVLGMTYVRNRQTAREIPVPNPTACFVRSNVLISRDLLTAAGGYAPFLPHSYDFDLGFRLAELNPTVKIAEDAIVYGDSPDRHCQWSESERRAFLSRNPRRSAVMIDRCVHLRLSKPPQAWDVSALESDPSSAGWRRLIAIAPLDEIPASFNIPIDDIVEHLSELAGAPRSAAHDYVTDAVAHGLLVGEPHGQLCFDLFHTLNWLRTKTLYLDGEIRNSTFARTHPTPRQRNRFEAGAVAAHCSGRYTLQLDTDSHFHWPGASLNIGIPIQHNFQRRVSLVRLDPPQLAPYVDQRRGLIADIPIELCIGNGGRIGYEFECEVAEVCSGAADSDGPSPKSRDLRFTYPPPYLERAAGLLDYILDGRRADAETDVRRIYRWIVENISAAPTHLSDCAVLEAGAGSCIALTRLFINLVRLRGIPAREQCGALMSRAISASEVLTVTLGHSPYSHTWAEVCWDGRLWHPVDFVVICYGRWRANTRNVSASLRTELEGQSERLLEYYFGNLDPYRIYADPCLNRLPPLLPSGLEAADHSLGEVLAHLRHRLVVSLLSESGNGEEAS